MGIATRPGSFGFFAGAWATMMAAMMLPGAMGQGREGLPLRDRRGTSSLADLFRGRSQLLVYHFMFGPDYNAGCPACSAIADGFNGFASHLANHDVMLWAVSRARLEKLQGSKKRMGWGFPWASSYGSDFNSDFDVALTEEQERAGVFEYNFRESAVWSPPEDGVVYLTYSAYAHGLDDLWGMYQWLGRAPRGRNEARGPADPLNFFSRHDEYGN